MNHRDVKAVTQAVAPVFRDAFAEAIQPLIERIKAIETRAPEKGDKGDKGDAGTDGKDAPFFSHDEMASVVHAYLEANPVPGPEGKAGRDGQPGGPGGPGRDGIDGNDGLGFDDMEQFEDERTFGVTFRRGDQIKEMRWQKSNPAAWYRGIWKEGLEYKRGETVTWNGSSHIALADTVAKPETSPDWRLNVKRGRDGKDGHMKPAEPKLIALK